MDHTQEPKAGVGRRNFFAGLVSGLGVAALVLSGRKARAAGGKPARKGDRRPILYRRTAETDRYLKTMH
jgi:hypothetical protein